jgi:hypothetical protein
MRKQGDNPVEENSKFSDSKELFESIFRQAIASADKEKTEKPKVAKGRRSSQTQPKPETRSSSSRKANAVAKKLSNQTPTPAPQVEKTMRHLTGAQSKTPKNKTRLIRESGRLKVTGLVILLVVLCGALVSYFGMLDLSAIPGLLRSEERKVAKAPQGKITRAFPRKAVALPPKNQAEPEVPPANANEIKELPAQKIADAPPAGASRTQETPESDQPIRKDVDGSGVPAPVTEKYSPPSRSEPKHEEGNVRADTRSGSARHLSEAEVPQKGGKISQENTIHYPYSVYLGSYRTAERLEKAISVYQRKGLSPYWAKVDLGDKGIWFRLFAGYFTTKEAAENYIKSNHIAGAEPGSTKYVVYHGKYRSADELKERTRELISLGFCPYTVKGADGKILLYSGAFDHKEFAETEQKELASKGIKAEVVER